MPRQEGFTVNVYYLLYMYTQSFQLKEMQNKYQCCETMIIDVTNYH